MAPGEDKRVDPIASDDTLVDDSHTRAKDVTADESMGRRDTLEHFPVSDSSIRVGTQLDAHYRVIRKLGEGAMGAVYEVEHVELGKHFAAKVINPIFAADEQAVQRLRQEARAAGAIDHENIVGVSHFGRTSAGQVFIVMDLLRGQDLRAFMEEESGNSNNPESSAPLAHPQVRELIDQIISGLGAAHDAGITHRDLKPENIFLARRSTGGITAKIVDFGISKASHDDRDLKLTQTGQIVGTPLYMAPEQTTDEPIDRRADIYALGVMMYEMLTGRLPFSANNVFQVVLMHRTEPPVPPRHHRPEIPSAVEAVILRCLAKSPNDRFQSAQDLRAAWTDAWNAASDSAPTDGSATSAGAARSQAPTEESHEAAPSRANALAVVFGIVVVAAGGWWWSTTSDAPTPDDAVAQHPASVQAAAAETPTIEAKPPSLPDAPTAAQQPNPAPPETAAHRVTVRSEPDGARLYVGEELRCTTPCDLEIAAGTVISGMLKKPGHRTTAVVLDGNTPAVLPITLPKRPAGSAPSLAPR